MTADTVMGSQFIGQAVQAQCQIEVGSVFADPRIIQSQCIAVGIAPPAKIRRLAVGIAKADTLIMVLRRTVPCQLIIPDFIGLVPVLKNEGAIAADGQPFDAGPEPCLPAFPLAQVSHAAEERILFRTPDMVIDVIGSHDSPYRICIISMIIRRPFFKPFDIPVCMIAVRHRIALARFMRIQDCTVEEKAVFLIRQDKGAFFVDDTGQDRPDSAVRPFAVYRMKPQLCRPCMGPFDIDMVVPVRIPCMAHVNDSPVPGEVPGIQTLIGSVLIQMDDSVIGLEAGYLGVPVQVPDRTVVKMKGNPCLRADTMIQIFILHASVQPGTGALKVRFQGAAGTSGQIPVNAPRAAVMTDNDGAASCRTGRIGAAVGRQSVFAGIQGNGRFGRNRPDFPVDYRIFRGAAADFHRHGIGLNGPHAAGRVDHDVPAFEAYCIGGIPHTPDTAIDLEQPRRTTAQVHGTAGGEHQILVLVGSFIDADGIAIDGISSVQAYQPPVDAYAGIRFHDGHCLVCSLLDYQGIVGIAVRSSRCTILIGFHCRTQCPAVRGRPVTEGDVLSHHIHPGNPVDQQPPFNGNGIGRIPLQRRPPDFHGLAGSIGIKGCMAGIVQKNVFPAYIQDRILPRDDFPVHCSLRRIFSTYLDGRTASVRQGKSVSVVFVIPLQSVDSNGLFAIKHKGVGSIGQDMAVYGGGFRGVRVPGLELGIREVQRYSFMQFTLVEIIRQSRRF